MKKIIFGLLAVLFSANAYAHVQAGTYEGLNKAGEKCAIQINAVEFVGGIRNPLNERVTVKLADKDFSLVLRHTPEIKDDTGEVSFEEEILREATFHAPSTAFSISLFMAEGSGPAKFIVNEHDWKTEAKMQLICEGLKKLN